jgi:hypothetical protein
MSRFASALNVQEFPALLCADPASLRGWIERTRCDRGILCRGSFYETVFDTAKRLVSS